MRPLVALALTLFCSTIALADGDERTLFAFDEPDLRRTWGTVNDGVMGGRSSGGPEFTDGVLTFAGTINTNGGGFSSIRTRAQDWDLEDHGGIALRVRGDGRTYCFDIRTGLRFGRRDVAYRAYFVAPEEDGWHDVRLPFDDFVPTVWGTEITGRVPELDPADARSIGIMLSDGIDGDFELRVDAISAFGGETVAALPEGWIGTWSGTCSATLGNSEPITFATSLEISPIAGAADRWTWTLVYGEGDARQVRDYELLTVDAAQGRFRIDEGNGIILEQRLVGEALYGRFVVGASDIVGVYRLDEEAGTITMELTTYAAPSDATQTGGGEGIPPVRTSVPVSVQRGVLERESGPGGEVPGGDGEAARSI